MCIICFLKAQGKSVQDIERVTGLFSQLMSSEQVKQVNAAKDQTNDLLERLMGKQLEEAKPDPEDDDDIQVYTVTVDGEKHQMLLVSDYENAIDHATRMLEEQDNTITSQNELINGMVNTLGKYVTALLNSTHRPTHELGLTMLQELTVEFPERFKVDRTIH